LGAEIYIYSLAVYNNKLYGGTYPNGKLYEWNGVDAWVEVAPRLGDETHIFSLAVYNNKLYGGTYPNGKLYEWNGVDAWVDKSTEFYIVGRVTGTIVRTDGSINMDLGEVNGQTYNGDASGVDYLATSTYPVFVYAEADATFVGTVDNVSVKEAGTVRASEANTVTLAVPAAVSGALADTGTIVMSVMLGYARAAGVVGNLLASTTATDSLIYTTTAAGNISSNDGTAVAESAAAYTANTWTKIALKWPSSTDKYRIGVDIDGAGIVWGDEQAFDGSFTVGANLILGYALHGPMWIKNIKFYDKILTDAQINATN